MLVKADLVRIIDSTPKKADITSVEPGGGAPASIDYPVVDSKRDVTQVVDSEISTPEATIIDAGTKIEGTLRGRKIRLHKAEVLRRADTFRLESARVLASSARVVPVAYRLHSWEETTDEEKLEALKALFKTYRVDPDGLTKLGFIRRIPLGAVESAEVHEKERIVLVSFSEQKRKRGKPGGAVIAKTEDGRLLIARVG